MARYSIEFDPTGDAERPYRLLEDGQEIGRFADAGSAGSAILEAQTAAGESTDAGDGDEFFGILLVEGVHTGNPDNRYLEPGMGEIRPTPLMLFMQTELPEFGGHAGAVLAGRIDDVQRLSDGRRMFMRGHFDTSADGTEASRLTETRMLRFVSADLAPPIDYTQQVIAVDDDGWPSQVMTRFGPYTIGGATMVGHPAIPQAVIWKAGMDVPEEVMAPLPDEIPIDFVPDGYDPNRDLYDEIMLLASAGQAGDTEGATVLEQVDGLTAAGQLAPPRAWFEPLDLTELTPIGITDDGEMFGHILPWDQAHTGYADRRIYAPHSRRGYSYFLTGAVRCDDGTDIPTGRVTIGGMHADTSLSAAAAMRHYDDASMARADVTVGEDQFGVWIHGAVRPGTTPEQVYELRASPPSGDWRLIEGGLELIICHSVNAPGFPVARVASAAGECSECPETVQALVAGIAWPGTAPARPEPSLTLNTDRSPIPGRGPQPVRVRDERPAGPVVDEEARAEVARLRAVVEPLLPLAAAQTTAGLGFEEAEQAERDRLAETERLDAMSPLERAAATGALTDETRDAPVVETVVAPTVST